VPEATEGMRT